MNVQADRARRERLRRGWSVRQAAAASGITNTYWANFEDYRQPLTPGIVEAVAKAFGWNEDWAYAVVDPSDPDNEDMRNAIKELALGDSSSVVGRVDELQVWLEEAKRDVLSAVQDAFVTRDVRLDAVVTAVEKATEAVERLEQPAAQQQRPGARPASPSGRKRSSAPRVARSDAERTR